MSWRIENAPKPKRIKVFGGFIRMRRLSLRMSQENLAWATNYETQAGFSSMELGKTVCPEDKLRKLATAIGVNLFDLKRVYDLDILLRARKADAEAMR